MECVPIAARLELHCDDEQAVDWVESATRGATQAGRRTGRRLTQLSEIALGFWTVLLLTRFFLDSMWRDVLISSPLAALGRLMVGMP
jgi:hypothetical protein